MSIADLLIGLILAGQVVPGANRYSQGAGAGDASGGASESLDGALGGSASPITPPADGAADTSDSLPMTGNAQNAVAPPSANDATSPFSDSSGTGQSYGSVRSGNGGGRTYPPPGAATPPASDTGAPIGNYPSQPSARSTAAAPAAVGNGLSPSALMRAMLHAPAGSRLGGAPISLSQVVSMAGTREEQSVCIDAYWDLCSSVADYYLGLHEQEELRRLRGLLGGSGPSADWQQAESELNVRVSTSQLAALSSQYRLASLMNRGWNPAGLPLPADIPHCGDYQTRYDQNFAGRSNDEARELSALLPLRFEELKGAGTAVTRAEQWLATVGQGGQAADETAMLRALELLALRRRAFVQIARDYNQRIARYSELATPGDIDPSRLVGMLIKSKNTPSTATRSSSSVPPFDRQSQGTAAPRQTYAEGWTPVSGERAVSTTRDDAVEQASAETQTLRKEKSLLVAPRGADR